MNSLGWGWGVQRQKPLVSLLHRQRRFDEEGPTASLYSLSGMEKWQHLWSLVVCNIHCRQSTKIVLLIFYQYYNSFSLHPRVTAIFVAIQRLLNRVWLSRNLFPFFLQITKVSRKTMHYIHSASLQVCITYIQPLYKSAWK